MKRQNIVIETSEGTRTVAAFVDSSFPGLALHRNILADHLWNATHINSGKALACFLPLRRKAAEYATTAASLIDFTTTESEVEQQIAKLPEVRRQLRTLAAQMKKSN